MTDISPLIQGMQAALTCNSLADPTEKQSLYSELCTKLIELTGGYIERNELTKEEAIMLLATVAGVGIKHTAADNELAQENLLTDATIMLVWASV